MQTDQSGHMTTRSTWFAKAGHVKFFVDPVGSRWSFVGEHPHPMRVAPPPPGLISMYRVRLHNRDFIRMYYQIIISYGETWM